MQNQIESNVKKLLLYRILRFAMLWTPVLIIYLQLHHGLSMTQIAALDAIYWIAIAIAEIPTGVVADRYGRKISILIGAIIYTLSALILATAQSFSMLILAFVTWAIASTLNSGAEQALLFESLALSGREDDYPQVSARLSAITRTAQVIGALLGGLLAMISLSLPFYGTVLLSSLSVFAALSLVEPETEKLKQDVRYLQILRNAWGIVQKDTGLLHHIFYLAVMPIPFFAVAMIYLQPYALEVGLPIAWFGVLTMVMRGAGVGGALVADKLAKNYGTQKILNVAPVALLGTLLVLSRQPSAFGLGLIAFICFIAAVVTPLGEHLINKQVPDQVRATVMSLQSLLFTLLFAVISIPLGMLADGFGLWSVFLALAGLFVVYGAINFVARSHAYLWRVKRA